MLSLSINELFFRICWDLSIFRGFPTLMKRISTLSSRFNVSRKNILGLAKAADVDRNENKIKLKNESLVNVL